MHRLASPPAKIAYCYTIDIYGQVSRYARRVSSCASLRQMLASGDTSSTYGVQREARILHQRARHGLDDLLIELQTQEETP